MSVVLMSFTSCIVQWKKEILIKVYYITQVIYKINPIYACVYRHLETNKNVERQLLGCLFLLNIFPF